jgi:L-aminopeptidase/D-esterase-like protein
MSDLSGWARLGHTTHAADRSGCSVILFDSPAPTAVDVRGGAPGTRETDLLRAGMLVGRADALLLSGGSAFGLAAADGVMRFLYEHGRGFMTSAGPVPIVPAAVIYDLSVGAKRFPTADDGYAAAQHARPITDHAGQIGGGTGATVAKLGGPPATPSGMSVVTIDAGGIPITAIVVLNAIGDIVNPADGSFLARANDTGGRNRPGRNLVLSRMSTAQPGENTTIGAVLINAPADRMTRERCCVAAHSALARCVIPAHTLHDGDTFFVSSRADAPTDLGTVLALSCAVEMAVEHAIVRLFEPGVKDD